MESPPNTNLQGLRDHWRNDLIAGLSVALVALPLALGIASAAGVPSISGLISVVVAGLVATFLRGSHIAINGPGNSLIVIVATGLGTLGGGADAFPHVLGAVVVSGGLQAVLGLLRLGKLGDIIPSAVVQGLLAAIGLIIVGKQLHVMVGQSATSTEAIEVFLELPQRLGDMNPFVGLIGAVSVLVMVVHPLIKNKAVHFIPAPLLVVVIAVPLALLFNFLQPHTMQLLGRSYHVGPELLVSIPDDLVNDVVHPAFSRIGEPAFWVVVLTFTLVNSIENIVSVKAVDKLDTYRRRSDTDRDLIGMGLSTVVAGMLGGLPVLTVIARSSVNANHGAKTGWSNFFQGGIILAFVLLMSPIIQEIPLAALAGILVYTGYKLTGVLVIEDTLRKGPNHFVIFCITVAATLRWGLLWGIGVGLVAELVSHLVILGLPPRESLARLWRTRVQTVKDDGDPCLLKVDGVANFVNLPRLRSVFDDLTDGGRLVIDFSGSLLADNTVLEYCHDFGRRFEHEHEGATFEVIGLEAHRALSDHPDALHVLERRLRAQRLTPRQQRVRQLADDNGWAFDARREWDTHLYDFHFFRVHPTEYREAVVRGHYTLGRTEQRKDVIVHWQLADVTFDEGVVMPDVHHTTALVLWLPVELPEFVLEREGVLDRVLELAGFQDIDFKHYTKFSRRFVLKGADEMSIRRLMAPDLLRFLEQEEIYHIESNGHEMVIFKSLRLASAREVESMLGFGERLTQLIVDGESCPRAAAPGSEAGD